MSFTLRSGAAASCPLGGHPRYPMSSCGSFYPGSASAGCSPGTYQQGCGLYSGGQASCYTQRPPVLCGPCPMSHLGPSGCGGAGLGPFACRGAGAQAPGCGRPAYSFSPRGSQSPCLQPAFGSRCFGPSY